jgi:hypothetical protein
MGKEKLEGTRQLPRIVALAFNPYSRHDVWKLRQKYLVPEFGAFCPPYETTGTALKKTWKWYRAYIKDYDKCAPTRYAHRYGKSKSSSKEGRGFKGILNTEVPFERELIALLERYQLPLILFDNLLLYALTEWPFAFSRHAVGPSVKMESDLAKIWPVLTVTVNRIGPWTTKKQWVDIWDNKIKHKLMELKETLRQHVDIEEPGRKRASREILHRWLQWFMLSEMTGLGPAKALDEWEQEHPDQKGIFDQSTVTHGIAEFREIITPIDTNTGNIDQNMVTQTLEIWREFSPLVDKNK